MNNLDKIGIILKEFTKVTLDVEIEKFFNDLEVEIREILEDKNLQIIVKKIKENLENERNDN